ncbi:hypothetical protein [Hymenobacter volaticus]|uniref:Uncharacterized protein n=1 Tax=Hymenobacter volaticus TaxID=2932254 RepID=A0ABY4GHB9_9BACT|nr:hypothetical protein [Hymenobacter volaticus]UOQ69829.1 hypothetical protein MUN86_30465 [Hymenobacter volaticus]
MNQSISTRLQQLRAELEASYESSNGLSVLYAIRRELLRYYQQLSPAQLAAYPPSQRHQLAQIQQELKTPPSFPAPSASAQYTATERALGLLERLLN